ncbi:glycosyltransferase [Litoricolaceae bacterium]|nr:glycosyltransferase [Litorivicinaceae bacterium]
MNFSVIVPFVTESDFLYENLAEIERQKRNDLEIILIPDAESHDLKKFVGRMITPVKIIESGKVAPGRKRDLASRGAAGQILVFFDDDSYPGEHYFDLALALFHSQDVIAAGGPGCTPRTDGFFAKVSGAAFLGSILGGTPERYVSVGSRRVVDDWPSVNFLIRKEVFLALEGFNSDYWPGEDTLFCNKLIQSGLANGITYEPSLLVWHHRRNSITRHFAQVANYAQHRGFFFKEGVTNSRKIKFAVPSFFVIFCCISVVYGSLYQGISPSVDILIFSPWLVYLILIAATFFEIAKKTNILISLCSTFLVFLNHIVYGFFFSRGILANNIRSRLRDPGLNSL